MYQKIEAWYLRQMVGIEAAFIIFCVLALLGDIACLLGLWENHSGNVLSLIALTLLLLSSAVCLYKWRHGDGKNAP